MLNKNLPPELPLDVVITEFGFDHYSKKIRYRLLFDLAKEGKVKIRIKSREINCQLESDGSEAVFDYYGDFDKLLPKGKTNWINTTSSEVDIYLHNASIDYSCSTVSINSIHLEPDTYLCVDETGQLIEPFDVHIDSLYVNSTELPTGNLPKKPKQPQRKTKGKSKQEQREEKLEKWFEQVTPSTSSLNTTFQDDYFTIKEPNKRFIWEKLSRIDSELFRRKASAETHKDFFKKWGQIRFEDGRGDDRNNASKEYFKEFK